MNILKIYYKLVIFYLLSLLITGLLLDSYQAFPGIYNQHIDLYSTARLLHQNIFEYGLCLNILTAIVLYNLNVYNIDNQRSVYFFWLFQTGIMFKISGNLVAKIQYSVQFIFDWLAVTLIVLSIVIFVTEVWNYYKYNLEISDSLGSYKKNKIRKSLKTRYNRDKNFIINYYIIIPVIVFMTVFILKHAIVSGLIYATIGFRLPVLNTFFSNVIDISYHVYIYNYFIITLLSGIFYLSFLPDRNHIEKIKISLYATVMDKLILFIQAFAAFWRQKNIFGNKDRNNDTTLLMRVSDLDDDSKRHKNIDGTIQICKIQWVLVTFIYMMILFFNIQFYIYREYILLIEKISVLLVPLSYAISFICFKFVTKRFIEDSRFKGVMNFAFMFFTIFILAEIITCIPNFQNTFMFTDWIVSQRHLFLSGFFLPVLYVFLIKNHDKLSQEGNFKEVISTEEHNPNERFWTIFWWFFTLSLSISGWVIGAVETGLWNKMDGAGYLEYPGWIGMILILKPFRIVRFIFFSALIFFVLFLFLYKRIAMKRRTFQDSRF
ncbi:MAG: hypothetical protein OEV78_04515 [Spirochaetia bacterium]|nr:hypothetical protein [Spirochaetia bacterium]